MGIYKNVTAIYGKNEQGKRDVIGLNINGIFYEGIKSPGDITGTTPKRSISAQLEKPKKVVKKDLPPTTPQTKPGFKRILRK